ncbi:MAG: hypothetical protein M1820_004602 [Bogoriella megaspora]|nr:MAG: hypothetical protein M1820_004602 [Bogoriella megaspora]
MTPSLLSLAPLPSPNSQLHQSEIGSTTLVSAAAPDHLYPPNGTNSSSVCIMKRNDFEEDIGLRYSQHGSRLGSLSSGLIPSTGQDFSFNDPDTCSGPHDEMMDVDAQDRDTTDLSALINFDTFADGLDMPSAWTAADSGIDMPSGSDTSEVYESISKNVSNTDLSIQEAPEPIHDCEAKAFTTLHSLHFCTMIHTDRPAEPGSKIELRQSRAPLSNASKRMPPLDKVLYFNRVAMSNLRDLLDCPCAQQPHLALLYMTIISKSLFWYKLAVSSQYQSICGSNLIQSQSPSCGGSIAGSNSPGGIQPKTTDRAVKSTPIQIGVFDLEEEDQKVLMRSVLLREVRKVEAIVDVMKSLSGTGIRDDDGDDEHGADWYGSMASRVKVEIQDTLKRIKEFGTSKSSMTNA